MKICYSIADQSFQRSKSIGILNVSLGLLESLSARPEVEEVVVFVNSSLPPIKGGQEKLRVVTRETAAGGRLRRILWDQWGLYRAAGSRASDWLFLPKGFTSFLRKPPLRLSAYVHDTMHDFYRCRYPGAFSPTEAWYFRQCLKATLSRASVVFTNSDFTRSEIRRLAGNLAISPPAMFTAGMGFPSFKTASAAKQDQVMVLISRWPHKLTRQALDFVTRWQQEVSYAGLVRWVGDLPEGAGLPNLPHSEHSWRVPDTEYMAMMAESRALVYFSEYEGFGMPPIESILQTTPPIYSAIPAMSESVLGYGFPFDNGSYASFSSAMSRALQCQPRHLQTWAKSLQEKHDWRRVAERVVTGLRETQNHSPHSRRF